MGKFEEEAKRYLMKEQMDKSAGHFKNKCPQCGCKEMCKCPSFDTECAKTEWTSNLCQKCKNSKQKNEQVQETANVCEVCGGKIITRCRCMGPHDMAALQKGHGRLCENGHRLGDGCYIEDKAAVERYNTYKEDKAISNT